MKVTTQIADIVDDDLYWLGLKHLVELLKPVVSAQALLEYDSCRLTDVMNEFRKIYYAFKGTVQ